MTASPKIIIIGAGVGGLTTAAILARAGADVAVLEAHVYPGGCAGTFYHKGYRFEAGATLAGGFYPGGPMDLVAKAAGIDQWPAHPDDLAMVVHLPDGSTVERWGGERRWDARREAFGPVGERFFRWQERTADALWDLALRTLPWPAQSVDEAGRLVQNGVGWVGNALRTPQHLAELTADAFRPVAAHLKNAPERLRQFIDGQLLIAAQATSPYANALYGASALDLPRRGVVHLEGGIGAIAETLAQAVRANGGSVRYRQEVKRIVMQAGRPVAVETKRGESIPADVVIGNLPPWNMVKLLGKDAPGRLKRLPPRPVDGWGAFMVYIGLDAGAVAADFPLHSQVIRREPMGEGNTAFLSLSPTWDAGRAPTGQRALTISTHTELDKWWDLYKNDRAGYDARKQDYVDKMLDAAGVAIPHLREAALHIMPGTPVTFQRFTRREWGWVGGFPQTNLFRTWGPKLGRDLWMVGDSIFPGQSTAAVALGGIRVAESVLREAGSPQRRKERKEKQEEKQEEKQGILLS